MFALILFGACDNQDDTNPADSGGGGGKADDVEDPDETFDHAAALGECLETFDAQVEAAETDGELVEATEALISCRGAANAEAARVLDTRFGERWETGSVIESLEAYGESRGPLCALISATSGFPPGSTATASFHVGCIADLEGGVAQRIQSYSAVGDPTIQSPRACSAADWSDAAERLGDSVILLHEALEGLDVAPTAPTVDAVRATGQQTCELLTLTTDLGRDAATCCDIAHLQTLTGIIDKALE